MCFFRVKLVEARYFPKPHQWAKQRQTFWFPHQSDIRGIWNYRHGNTRKNPPSCFYITIIYYDMTHYNILWYNMTTVLGSFLFEVIWRRSLHRHLAALTIDDVPLLNSPSTLEDCFEPQYQDFTPKGKVFQEKHPTNSMLVILFSCLLYYLLWLNLI